MSASGTNSTPLGQTTPQLPWLQWPLGARVVVRRREDDGLYDAVGELLEASPDHVLLRTRKGEVRIPALKMVTGRLVEPPIRQAMP